MSVYSKRKKSTPVSSRAKTRKRTPEPAYLWGELKEHFRPVKISATIPGLTRQTSDLHQFIDVSYTEYKTGELIAAEVEIAKLSLMVEQSLKTDLHHKLGPLIQKLEPLENLTTIRHHEKTRWCWKTDLGTPHMDPLCRDFCKALRYNMVDTEGKHAMTGLLKEIITRLNRSAALFIIATGSTKAKAKATRCACLIEMDFVDVPSSSSEEYTQEYVNYSVPSEIEDSSVTLKSSVQFMDTPKPTGPGSSSTDKQSPRPKRRTSDVLVFSHESDYEPIVTNLVVSIKCGTGVDPRGFVQELLGRLPYQSGIIYGLEINQLQANLYSVEKYDGDSGAVVRLSSYPEYSFQKGIDFNFLTLKTMVLDIGFILMVNHDHRP